jgi:hypothetical protein
MLYGLGDDEFHEHLAAERQHHDEERKRAAGIAHRDGSISTLLPAVLDDYVGEDNPVRAIDVFVDGLDLAKLGFDDVAPLATGRPAYHPAPLLKIYIYGYSIASSRADGLSGSASAMSSWCGWRPDCWRGDAGKDLTDRRGEFSSIEPCEALMASYGPARVDLGAPRRASSPHGVHQSADAQNLHHTLHVVGQHVQRHFAGHFRQPSHLEVRGAHPRW